MSIQEEGSAIPVLLTHHSPPRWCHMKRLALPLLAIPVFTVLALTAGETEAQTAGSTNGWLPSQPLFQGPLADPLEPGLRGALVYSDLLEPENFGQERPADFLDAFASMKREAQALVNLGGGLPLWQWGMAASGAIQVGIQAGVTARFRMSVPTNDLVATDWVAALPVEARWGEWSGRMRFLHRSAHLGDEFLRATQALRVGFAHESVQFLAAWEGLAPVRLYGGGTWVARSETDNWMRRQGHPISDKGEVQLGFELRPTPENPGPDYVFSLDWQAHGRTRWANQWTGAAGLTLPTGDRSVTVLARGALGRSPMGQFFLTRESSFGLEFVLVQ
ncbi:MAG: DUF1207 domain-containing protein [Gemmatimonadota bacterium]